MNLAAANSEFRVGYRGLRGWLDQVEKMGELQRASKGDMVAARLVLERIAPPRRGHPVHLKLPPIGDAASVMVAQAVLVSAVSTGNLTPPRR